MHDIPNCRNVDLSKLFMNLNIATKKYDKQIEI